MGLDKRGGMLQASVIFRESHELFLVLQLPVHPNAIVFYNLVARLKILGLKSFEIVKASNCHGSEEVDVSLLLCSIAPLHVPTH